MSRMMEPLTVGRVVGEVVDMFTPTVKMDVIYSSCNKQVANGHEIMPSVITAKPRVDIGGDDMRGAYTLVTTLSLLHIYASLASYIYQILATIYTFILSSY